MNDTLFFATVRQTLFKRSISQSQVDGINFMLGAWAKLGDGDVRKLAYILATMFWETAQTMQPIEEYGKGRGHKYGAPTGPWHQVYDGRGDVQLTWEANYKKATDELRKAKIIGLDVDLEKNPELAMRPDISAAVAILGMQQGWFTTRKLSDYIGAPGHCDYEHARQIINGMDKAIQIGGYATLFLNALKGANA